MRSWVITSHATTSSTATLELLREERRRTRPRSDCPSPHIGTTCCCRSSTTPRSFTSRSRWIASCDSRSSGRSTSTSRTSPLLAARLVPTRPRSRSSHELTQRAAVHVDAELAVAGAARVGARLDPQVRAVGVRADHHEARARVVEARTTRRSPRPARRTRRRHSRRAARRCSGGGTPPCRGGRPPTPPRGTAKASAPRKSRMSVIRRALRSVPCPGGEPSR